MVRHFDGARDRRRLMVALVGVLGGPAVALALAGAAPPPATPRSPPVLVPEELRDLDAFLLRLSAMPGIPERLEAASRPFLGLPYALDALGEGEGAPDSDPLWSFVACDCQTLVEEVIALAFSRDAAEFHARMLDIRYVGGEVSFETRKHLVEPRWLPTLVEAGYLAEETTLVGRKETALAEMVVDDATLAPKFSKLRKRAGKGWPTGRYELRYVPLDVALARHVEIPTGTVLLPVRAPRADTPFLVSHMGLVLAKDGKRIFRHASSSPIFKKVVDQSVPSYLGFLRKYFGAKERPVIGVALYRVTEPGALVRAK